MKYRRVYFPGGTFFFTLVTYKRRPLFSADDMVSRLRQVFGDVKNKRPFDTRAIVILPDHIHCIWTLPPGDSDYSTRWRLIKTAFSYTITSDPKNNRVWQLRFWEHFIRDELDLQRHIDYIHFNPVKHGLVLSPKDWPYSSFHRYVADGLYPIDWAASDEIRSLDNEMGE
jgi:putative transposase